MKATSGPSIEKAQRAKGPRKRPAFFRLRSERIRTSDLYVPNVALYQAKLHSV